MQIIEIDPVKELFVDVQRVLGQQKYFATTKLKQYKSQAEMLQQFGIILADSTPRGDVETTESKPSKKTDESKTKESTCSIQ